MRHSHSNYFGRIRFLIIDANSAAEEGKRKSKAFLCFMAFGVLAWRDVCEIEEIYLSRKSRAIDYRWWFC